MNLNQSLHYSYNTKVESAYIIRVQGHPESERLALRCAQSCEQVGMPFQFFDAVDGTSGELKVPEFMHRFPALKWLKIMDHYLSPTEIACALSHIALWMHCLDLDRPIVILEHDAVMVNAFKDFPVFNQIVYLGAIEQTQGWPVMSIPPHATLNKNYHFICRTHSYAIDPSIARNLVSHVLKFGIHESLDVMIRADIFPITQMGFYAYDDVVGTTTTIVDRKKTPDGKER